MSVAVVQNLGDRSAAPFKKSVHESRPAEKHLADEVERAFGFVGGEVDGVKRTARRGHGVCVHQLGKLAVLPAEEALLVLALARDDMNLPVTQGKRLDGVE